MNPAPFYEGLRNERPGVFKKSKFDLVAICKNQAKRGAE